MKNSFGLFARAMRSSVAHMGCWFGRNALLGAGIIALFAAQPLMATGTVKGTVTDRMTKDQLPGAHVVIKGTSIGAATNLDGVYILHNVSSGEQTLTVTYVGYTSKTVTMQRPRRWHGHPGCHAGANHD